MGTKKAYRETPRVRRVTPKSQAGGHNRKARRAAKAQQPEPFTPADPEIEKLRALWAAFGRHTERTRYLREARSAAFTVEQYDSENEPLPPDHLNITELLRRVELQHERLRALPFEDRRREAQDLAELIGGSPWLCDQSQIIDTPKGRIENNRVGDGLAAALAIGSLQPGGIKLWSMWFESDGETLVIRFLVDPQSPWLEVTACA